MEQKVGAARRAVVADKRKGAAGKVHESGGIVIERDT
jgi:hypothetical protein